MNTSHFTFKVAILTSALFAVPLFAGSGPNYTYLALGDSISFGYDPNVTTLFPANYTGYPEIVAADLNVSEVNASCPGQTSASFLTGEPDNGCEDNGGAPGFKSAFGLHAAYTGTQMNFAVSQLRANPNIRLVTLSIGGNDLLLLQKTCQTAPIFSDCVANALNDQSPTGFLGTYGNNLGQILGAIRGTGYQGAIVLTKYAVPNNDPTYSEAIGALNTVMLAVGSQFGAIGADGFTAFLSASASYGFDPCQAGLLTLVPGGNGACDVHPDYAGQQILAGTVLDALKPLPPITSTDCAYTGTFKGNLTVNAGQNCSVVGGTVTGNVTLNGGTLALSNAKIAGNVSVQNGGAVSVRPGTVIGGNLVIQNIPGAAAAASQVCGSTVKGSVTLQNNGIPVAIGSNSLLCPGNAISGNLVSQNNVAPTAMQHNSVKGNLQDQNNGGGTEVFDNIVTDNLQCQNNSRIFGGTNTAGQKQGQCAGF